MNQRTYSFREKLLLGLLFLASIASLLFYLKYRTLAFPEHAIRFDINRQQAAIKAQEFVEGLALELEGYKHATIFTVDDTSKTYLERELAVEETARLAESEVATWYFTTRFFKPLQKEEFSVSFLPNGRFVNFFRQIEEATPAAHLTKDQAQVVAEQFLANHTLINLAEWQLVSAEVVERPNRTDYTITWEKRDFKAKEATYRLQVGLLGDEIGEYQEFLKIPEAWERQYEKETSRNELAQTVADAITFIFFGLTLLLVFIIQYRESNLRLRFSWWAAGVAAIVALLTSLNSLPLALYGYPTTVSWSAFLGEIVFLSIIGALFQGIVILFIIAAGEALYRSVFPQGISLETTFTRGLRTKRINQGLLVGVFTGVIFFIYEIAYYFLGRKLGFWAPAEIKYDDVFSTVLPWVYPLFTGFMAAVMEEGIFRLFGIPFLKKHLKSTWLAILITSVVWAFLHSNYPQSPWFVRGIEISVVGIVFGILFVRYGVVASIAAHYTFNALQVAIFMYASQNIYASVSSTVVALIPLFVALGALPVIQTKGFVDEKGLSNESIGPSKVAPTSHAVGYNLQNDKTTTGYLPLATRFISFLTLLAVISGLSLPFLLPETTISDTPVTVNRQEAVQIATSALDTKGVDTRNYRVAAAFYGVGLGGLESEYILEQAGFDKVKETFPSKLKTSYWSIRFFKPLEKEEYAIDILPGGEVDQIFHTVDEKASGANLNQEEAIDIAQNYLVTSKNYVMANYTLIENKTEKRDNRTDHTLIFEEKDNKIGEATFRTTVVVQGDEVASFSQYLKIPEDWEREKMKTTTRDFIIGGSIGIFVLTLIVLSFLTFLSLTKERKIYFRRAAIVAGGATILFVLGSINSLPTFFHDYPTSIPLQTYIAQSSLFAIVGLVFGFFALTLTIGMLLGLWKQYISSLDSSELRSPLYVRDAVAVGYALPILSLTGSSLFTSLLISQGWLKQLTISAPLQGLDHFLPAFTTLTGFPLVGSVLAVAGIGLLVLRKYLKKWGLVLGALAIVVLLTAIPGQRTLADFGIALLQNLVSLIGGALVIFIIARKNLWAYLTALYVSVTAISGWDLLGQGDTFYKINGIILLVLTLAPALYYLSFKLSKGRDL